MYKLMGYMILRQKNLFHASNQQSISRTPFMDQVINRSSCRAEENYSHSVVLNIKVTVTLENPEV